MSVTDFSGVGGDIVPSRRPGGRGRRHIAGTVALAATTVAVVLVAISLIGALATPGNESFEAKWADWWRNHHAEALVNKAESTYYRHNAPSRGGRPDALNAVPTPVPVPGADPADGSPLPAPAPVPLVVSPGLAGEGVWQPAGPLVSGRPAMYVSQFRADSVYTSQITSAVWIDTSLLQISLVPGATVPGGTWPMPPNIAPADETRTVAAFNGGFRIQDARGGFYLDGRQAAPLRDGAASLVIYANGSVDIGTWGTEVTMTPDVRAVLQNLVPIVDHGQLAPAATYNDASVWGSTLGFKTVVARSGVGVTANGALVYVAGPALTARSLAESLQRAGAVRAMTLDINPEWVTFNFYHDNPAAPGAVAASKLYPEMSRPATRYLGPTRESRDFFSVSLPAPTSS